MAKQNLVVWRIVDDKAGHLSQSKGLVNALAEVVPLKAFDIPTLSRMRSIWWYALGKFPPGNSLPKPDLIVGAGHATHLAMLAARRARGGKAIVLGKPSLPLSCFDLCLTPVSDGMPPGENVVLTWGVLNLIHPSNRHDGNKGLVLIGGPSGSHRWDNDLLLHQIAEVLRKEPHVQWQLTTSRRTPREFTESLLSLSAPNLKVVPYDQTTPDWVPERLAYASRVWVTEDSVSMVYEALTSGAAVGLLSVPVCRAGRVTRGMSRLRSGKWVTAFDEWDPSIPMPSPPRQIDEARRCADLICQRYGYGLKRAA